MIITSIQGEEKITHFANLTMEETINYLVRNKHLTEEAGKEFLDTHVAIFITTDGGFVNWVKRFFKLESNESMVRIAKL